MVRARDRHRQRHLNLQPQRGLSTREKRFEASAESSSRFAKHRLEEEPDVHQVLQLDGIHRGHGTGAGDHPDHGLHLDAQSDSGGKPETEDSSNHDNHHSHVHGLSRAQGKPAPWIEIVMQKKLRFKNRLIFWMFSVHLLVRHSFKLFKSE